MKGSNFVPLLFVAVAAFGQIKMPPFQRVVLNNGAVVVLMPKKDLPLVSIRISVKGGSEADPPDLSGMASLTAEMLSRGTATRSREKLAQELDQLGIQIQAVVRRQYSSLEMEFLSKDTAQALTLLEDMLTRSAFAEDEVKRLVEQRADAVKSMKDQPQMALREYLSSFYYGKGHPYGRSGNGDELSVPKITRAAMVSWFQKNYSGKNMIIVAAGDFDPAAMADKLKAVFAKLPPGDAYEWKKASAPPASAEPRLLLVDMPEATQTYFAISQPGIERTSGNRTALELVNTLFGGRFTSMLNDALRVDTGLTYGASSSVQMDRLPGNISISTFTKTDTTEAAMDLALKQLDKLRTKGIDADQLASAKAYVKGEYPTRSLETVDQLSVMLTDFEVYGLNRGEVDDLISRIDSVSLERANAIARQYYKSEGLVFVVVGDAAKIRKTVGKYAKNMTEVKIATPGF